MPNNRPEQEERLRRAMKYYQERISRNDGYFEERYYSQFRVGTIMKVLEYPWKDTFQELMKAYSMEPLRAEPLKVVIDHYLMTGDYELAYMYSKFCRVNFHKNNPYPKRLLFVDEQLYAWKILEAHAGACFYTGRKDEAKSVYQELISITKANPSLFSPDDLQKIESNRQFFN